MNWQRFHELLDIEKQRSLTLAETEEQEGMFQELADDAQEEEYQKMVRDEYFKPVA